MSDIRKKIERSFESFGGFIYENRIKVLLLLLLFVVALASGVRKARFDTSTEAFLHPDDPVLLTYNTFRDQFGRDEMIVLALEAEDIFEQGFLVKLKALHEDLETSVPHLDEVTSLINARSTRGEADQLIVEDFLERWPENVEEMAAIKARALANPLYRNLLISENGRFTAVAIKTNSYSSAGESEDALEGFDDMEGFEDDKSPAKAPEAPAYLSDMENSEVVAAVREVVSRHKGPDFPIIMGGSPVVTDDLKRSMMRDARLFVLLAVIIISFCLLLLFRRLTGVLLPILTVVLSLVSTIGLMGHLGVALKLPTNVLPSFLIAVGVGDSVHILTIFYRRLSFGDSREAAIKYALGHSGLAVVMTTLTTAGGLFSFYVAEVAPIAELGIFAGCGVILAMIYTLLLLPALLALLPVRAAKVVKDEKVLESRLDHALAGIGDFSTRHPVKVIVVFFLIVVFSIWGALQSTFSHNVLKWLPDDMEIRQATEKIDENLKGATVLEVVVDTGQENGLYDPKILNALEEMTSVCLAYESPDLFVGKVTGITTILKEIHQALNENRAEYYVVPQDPALIPQEFLLFENSGSDDLEDFVDSQFSKTRMTLKVPWQGAIVYGKFIETIEQLFKDKFKGEAEITVTGLVVILGRTLSVAIHSMAKSYVIAFIVITCLMVLLIGNVKVGLISMIPNLTPIIIAMGIIGLTDIPLDMFTMLVGSVAIGLAVDDTIHFMHNFRRYYNESGSVSEAVHHTLQTTGRAMFFTTIVLSIGFFILTASKMHNLTNFGIITSVTILLALLSDFFLAPALMAVVYRKGKKMENKGGNS